MPEETKEIKKSEEKTKEASDASPSVQKLPGKWFRKIPVEILLSPGGMILIFFAIVLEILDLVPIPFVDYLWEIPKELFFMIFLAIIAKIPLQSMVIPFIVERIPIISDIVPTWFIRLFF